MIVMWIKSLYGLNAQPMIGLLEQNMKFNTVLAIVVLIFLAVFGYIAWLNHRVNRLLQEKKEHDE